MGRAQRAAPRVGILTPRSFGAFYRNLRPLMIAFVEGDMFEPESGTTAFTDHAQAQFKLLRKLTSPDAKPPMPTCPPPPHPPTRTPTHTHTYTHTQNTFYPPTPRTRTQTHKHTNTQTHKHTNTQTHKPPQTQLRFVFKSASSALTSACRRALGQNLTVVMAEAKNFLPHMKGLGLVRSDHRPVGQSDAAAFRADLIDAGRGRTGHSQESRSWNSRWRRRPDA